MKKRMCMFLALILMMSLVIPAAALEDMDPPLWEQYGYASKEEMLSDWGIDEQGYQDEIQQERLWIEQEDWTSAQWSAYYDEQLQLEKDNLGLVYDVNVMLRDKAFTFTDAAPEIKNGRTMVPLSAVMENMGASVAFDDATKTATITKDDKVMRFVLGSEIFTITQGEDTSEITLDSAPYLKDNYTYVPVHVIAEAMGYDVFWDNHYETAVFLDKDAIVGELDEGFTVINKVLAMASSLDLTKAYRSQTNLDVKITSLDSIDGEKTYTCALDTVVLQNGNAAKMTVSVDVKSILSLVEDSFGAMDYYNQEEIDAFIAVLSALDGDAMEFIIDLDGGMLYMRGELLSYLAQTAGVELSAKAWVSVDMSTFFQSVTGFDLDDYREQIEQYQNRTMGKILYMQYTENLWINPVYAYSSMVSDVDGRQYVDDSMFTKSGKNYRYRLDLTDEYQDVEGGVDVEVVMSGDKATLVKGSVDVRSNDFYRNFLTEAQFSLSATQLRLTGSFHEKNEYIVELSFVSTAKETNETVPTAPASGDEVVPIESLIPEMP
jgi:hypothetical protein